MKDQVGFDFVVRFRGIVRVESADGQVKVAKDWLPANGRRLVLRGAKVTTKGRALGAVVCVKAKGMKDARCLATSHGYKPASEIVKLYDKRFTIEESFRDQKNLRLGMGLSDTSISTPARRDRTLFICAFAITLVTILGAVGRAAGLVRTLSLLNQSLFHYAALPSMKTERADFFMAKVGEMLREQTIFRDVFGLI